MPAPDLAVICIALGAALVIVGVGIIFAYRHTLPPGHDPAAQPNKQPDWLTLEWLQPVLRNFLMSARICVTVGVVLVIAGGILAEGQGMRAVNFNPPISLYYAAALALLLVVLSYNVLHFRVKSSLTNTDQDLAAAEQMVRVHANFTEYVPTGLALLIALEWAGAPAAALHVGGGIFTLGRVVHAWGYARETAPSLPRILGIQSTLLALAYMAVLTVYYLSVA